VVASVVIVDYDAGNLRSVQRACAKVGIDAVISADPERVMAADKVIFPGVGSAESAVAGVCKRFDFDDPALKVPHIGWNEVEIVKPHPLLAGIQSGDEFYFVHAYYVEPKDQSRVYGVTDYGFRFCSMLGQDNLFATQFHLEKSGRMGLAILSEFKSWDAI
jgi:glutamine amidotransferase